MTGINHAIIENSKYYRISTLLIVILIVTAVGFNILLIPHYGLTGVAIGTLLSTALFNFLKTAFIVWKFRLQPFNYKFVEAGVLSAGIITGFYFLPYYGVPYLEAPLKGGLIGLILVVLYCRRKYSPEFNHLVFSVLGKFWKKFR